MAYYNSRETANIKHKEFAKLEKEAYEKGLNYGKYVAIEKQKCSLTIEGKIRYLKESGDYNYQKVLERPVEKEKTNNAVSQLPYKGYIVSQMPNGHIVLHKNGEQIVRIAHKGFLNAEQLENEADAIIRIKNLPVFEI